MAGITIKLPIGTDKDSPGGFQHVTTHKALVRQNMRNLILTIPGERIMDPNFGIGPARYLFTPSPLVYELETEILSKVKLYMPYVEITNIRIALDEETGQKAYISISYQIVPLQDFDELNITVEGD